MADKEQTKKTKSQDIVGSLQEDGKEETQPPSDKINIDRLPEEVLEQVFTHLTVSELCEASLVCVKWNDIIARSEKCMKKMKLTLRSWVQASLELELFHKMIRNYQSVKISQASLTTFHEYFFDYSWRSMEFSHSEFTKRAIGDNLLKTVEPIIEEFRFDFVINFKRDPSLMQDLIFPKLTKLTVVRSNNVLENFLCCRSLKELKCKIAGEGNLIQQLLINNHLLKNFECRTDEADKIFNENLAENAKCKLTHFSLNFFVRPLQPQPMTDFLSLQRNLRSLSLCGEVPAICLKAIFGLPSLKKLHLDLRNLSENIELAANSSIDDLTFDENTFAVKFLKVFAVALPNLKMLKSRARFINSVDFESLATNLAKLESFHVSSIRINPETVMTADLLPNLKSLKAEINLTEEFDEIDSSLFENPKNNFHRLLLKKLNQQHREEKLYLL